MEEATTQLHRIVSTIQNELTHSSRAHVLEESLSSAVTCLARFQHAWSLVAWPETRHRGWSECCGIAKPHSTDRAVVLTACVELGCGRWSSTSCLFSSDEACSALVERRPGVKRCEVMNVVIITLGEGNVKHSRFLVHHVWSMCAQAAPSDGRVPGRRLVRISVLPS